MEREVYPPPGAVLHQGPFKLYSTIMGGGKKLVAEVLPSGEVLVFDDTVVVHGTTSYIVKEEGGLGMSIHIYTQPPRPWDDAAERAASAGYVLNHIAGPELSRKYGHVGGPFGVFKDGELLARFTNAVDRDKWLYEEILA